MKVLIRFAGGLEANRILSRLPAEGETIEGQVVREVQRYEGKKHGVQAIVIMHLPDE